MSAIWKRPDGTVIETEKQFITELNSLLARAEKAEAERDELKRKLSDSEDEKLDLVKLSCVDWQRVRIDAAIATMQGMWACPDTNFRRPMEEIAVECADALVAELQRKEVQG